MDLQAETVPEQVGEFGMPVPVEGLDAEQELVVVSGKDGLPECGRCRADREIAAEDVDAFLAVLPE
jgi:hypothetical protein